MLQKPLSRDEIFLSAKTETAIHVAHPLMKDVLIQASLDPTIRQIRSVQTAPDGAQAASPAIVITREDGRFLLDVIEARRDAGNGQAVRRAFERLGVATLKLSSTEITAEPRCTNARAVWRHRMQPVGIDMRMKILTALADDGALRLGELLSRINAPRDPAPAVMALACSDLIELELFTQPLGPTTIVRSRS